MSQHVIATVTPAVDFQQGISDAWSRVVRFVPELVAFLVIMVIGWLLSKLISKALDRVLRKVGFARVGERAGPARIPRESTYDATAIICKAVHYALLLVTLRIAFGVLGPNPVSVMITDLVAWLPRAVVALVLVVVAMAIANAVRALVQGVLSGMSYGRTVATVARAAIVALGVIAALGQAGIATAITQPVLYAVLATAAGILVVGVGGGLIQPMRERTERWLSHAEQETSRAKEGASAYRAGREDAMRDQPARERARPRPGRPVRTAGGGSLPGDVDPM
ncbi:hypothetical protein [Streptomyces sp. NPDC006368]|uniref:mechanosensitive ion channel family protein n=1 Tax=Streptomyces sp. NPDC006368 TaxID=3156760 RepID=UPI0033B792F3